MRLPFFIMPFVEGESLRARLSRGPLSVREAVSILKDVARALVYAHGRGIIHRDIKPDNILLSSGGSATVTDFGVAKAISASREGGIAEPRRRARARSRSSARRSARRRTWRPSRPRAIRAPITAPTSTRSASSATRCSSARRRFTAARRSSCSPRSSPSRRRRSRTRRYDVPEALAALLMSLLEKDPAKRPKTAAEVARALEDPSVVSGDVRVGAGAQRAAAEARAVGARRRGHSRVGRGGRRVVLESARAGASTTGIAAAPVVAAKSIAVMPLVNISRDTSDAYFAAGMTAELTNALSRIPGLRVATPTESAKRDQAASPTDIGKTLNVTMVLFGTVQRDKDRLRVTARLVNTADGFTVWSDMFERDSKDVFNVQDEISSGDRRGDLTGADVGGARARRARAPRRGDVAANNTARPISQAYDLYLRGRFFFEKRGEAGLRRALDYFQQAAKKDTGFARAYAGIANVYALLPLYANVRVDSVMPLAMRAINQVGRARQHAARGLRVARDAVAGRLAMGRCRERLSARTLARPQLRGSTSMVRRAAAAQRPPAEARAQLKRATELDPLSPVSFGSYALALAVARSLDTASIAGRRAVELDSTLLVTRFMLGTVYLQAAKVPEAIRAARVGRQARFDVDPDDGSVRICICQIRQTRLARPRSPKRSRRDRQGERRWCRRGARVSRTRRQGSRAVASRARGGGPRLVLLQRIARRSRSSTRSAPTHASPPS